MSDLDHWKQDAADFGWQMPTAPRWKRLPVIRHARSAWLRLRVEWHYTFWGAIGAARSGYDNWVIFGIARGFERDG